MQKFRKWDKPFRLNTALPLSSSIIPSHSWFRRTPQPLHQKSPHLRDFSFFTLPSTTSSPKPDFRSLHSLFHLSLKWFSKEYRADGVDGPQEILLFLFPVGHPPHPPCTACGHRMTHRKWKEIKQQPSLLPGFPFPVGNPMSAGCKCQLYKCIWEGSFHHSPNVLGTLPWLPRQFTTSRGRL